MIKIKVPATSANLGPGFDCMGMALSKYNIFFVEEIPNGLVIEGCKEEYKNKDNLFYVSLKETLKEIHEEISGVRIIFNSNIPLKGGLGSSATCIIGGILAAFTLKNIAVDESLALKIALKLEGHPDNIVPALLGSVTVAIVENDVVYYEKFIPSTNFQYIALSPNMELSTEASRSLIPKEIPLKDGVFNCSHATMLALSLANGNIKNIKVACKDKFHQDYRGKLIPNFFDILKFAEDNGAVASFLSGAGPTIMIINEQSNNDLIENLRIFLSSFTLKWTLSVLELDTVGATISKGGNLL